MPSLKAIRTRIASVKNTQKITRAMKLVAAARLRRAQDAMTQARPYARRLAGMVADIAARLEAQGEDVPSHPLLSKRPIKTVRLIVVSSDRGLAGGFNSNLNRRVERFLVDERTTYEKIELAVIGRKAREHFRRRQGKAIAKEYAGVTSETAHDRAREIANDIAQAYLAGEVDAVFLVYNEFKSAISQIVQMEPLLPLKPSEIEDGNTRIDFEYEPSKEEVLSTILPLYMQTRVLQAMLESVASFFGAQMSAMDNATKNAKEMIGTLTLEFNRARQAAITKELMEIVGGAEALKG
jgi:F-type H+-transporting ATPase subunit gamma